MAFEDIKAEIALLFQQMVNQPQDAHEIRETIRESSMRCAQAACLCRKIWSSLKSASNKISIPENGPAMRLQRSSPADLARKGILLLLRRGAQRLQYDR